MIKKNPIKQMKITESQRELLKNMKPEEPKTNRRRTSQQRNVLQQHLREMGFMISHP